MRACVRVRPRACRTIIEAWSANYVSPTYVPLDNPPSSPCLFLSRTPSGSSAHHTVTYAPAGFSPAEQACACPVESCFSFLRPGTRDIPFLSSRVWRITAQSIASAVRLSFFPRASEMTRRKSRVRPCYHIEQCNGQESKHNTLDCCNRFIIWKLLCHFQ